MVRDYRANLSCRGTRLRLTTTGTASTRAPSPADRAGARAEARVRPCAAICRRDGVVPICGDAHGQGVYILAPLGKLLSELLESRPACSNSISSVLSVRPERYLSRRACDMSGTSSRLGPRRERELVRLTPVSSVISRRMAVRDCRRGLKVATGARPSPKLVVRTLAIYCLVRFRSGSADWPACLGPLCGAGDEGG